jgi:excisionase family DNA binding protein
MAYRVRASRQFGESLLGVKVITVVGEPKEFLTLAEVAQHLRLSKSKLYADRRTGHLPVLRFGRLIRIRRSDMEGYIRRATHAPDSNTQKQQT